ncbi:MAG: GNAT family N-acetyltransferase [Patescibacteria group bacterium]
MFSQTFMGEKIIVRPYQKEDISAWQKWDTDPDVQRHMPELKNMPMSDEEQWAYFEECKSEQSALYWSIVWKENQKLIGTISLTDINEHHGVTELGIVLGEKEYWGRGVAREAIELILTFAKTHPKLRRIIAEYEEGNIAMGKALEHAGFQQECVCRASRIKNGMPINTIRYYILLQ